MNAKKIIKITMIGVVSIFLFTMAWAAGSGRTLDLEPTKHHPDASGTAFIDKSHVSVQTRGLKPNAVYTMWFVNMKPKKHETGAGTAPYMLKSNLRAAWHYIVKLLGDPVPGQDAAEALSGNGRFWSPP